MATVEELKRIASQVRRDIVRMVTDAKSGHPGGSLSSADVLTALYFNEMKIDPENWKRDGKNEDVFILSAGHMTPVYYSILSRRGYFPVKELATFRLRPELLSERNLKVKTVSCMCFAVMARARKDRFGRPACLLHTISWTTSLP